MISDDKLHTVNAKLTTDLKSFKEDIQGEINTLKPGLKKEISTLAGQQTAQAIREFKQEMKSYFQQTLMTMFNTQMIAFCQEMTIQFGSFKIMQNPDSANCNTLEIITQPFYSTEAGMDVE
eukprot:34729-Ditylum_brightwellii.AAC.2